MVGHRRNISLELIVEEIGGVVYTEAWTPVSGYEGIYSISSFGRLKRLARVLKSGAPRPDRIVLPSLGKKKKYLKYSLRKDMLVKSISLHRLVGLHFIEPVPGKDHINHKTGDKLKNHYTQLEWCTPQENNEHGVQIGLLKRGRNIKPRPKKGYPVGNKKIVNVETMEIFAHAVELSQKTGTSIKTIRRALTGERYNHTPYRYVGQEDVCLVMPPKVVKEKILKPIAQFDVVGNLVATFNDFQQVGDKTLRSRVGYFLAGRSRNVDGFLYKLVAADGSYVEPPKFVSQKKERQKSEINPSSPKEVIQFDLQGNEVARHKSINEVGRLFGKDRRNFKRQLKKSPRNYYKGFIWKYGE
jgi:hypothetical protein